MELDISRFVEDNDMFDFAHSEAEHGGPPGTAGKATWEAALAVSDPDEHPEAYFVTADNREEIEAWVRDFGAWEREEIAAWSDRELNALLVQFIAGDMREYEEWLEHAGEHGDDDEPPGRIMPKDGGAGFLFYVGL